ARRVVDEVLAGAGDGDQGARQAYRKVFFVAPEDAGSEREAASQILTRFATDAFRRPVDKDFVERLMALYDNLRERGEMHPAAVGHALTAILISPRFLMRSEQQRTDVDGPYRVDDFDLASRLSFFLWSA